MRTHLHGSDRANVCSTVLAPSEGRGLPPKFVTVFKPAPLMMNPASLRLTNGFSTLASAMRRRLHRSDRANVRRAAARSEQASNVKIFCNGFRLRHRLR